MFERLFLSLLRLYPSRFRRIFGEEARWLICERFRDETGLIRRFRLCLDLIADFGFGLPVVWRTAPVQAAANPALFNAGGNPSFRVLEDARTSPVPFLVGSAITFAALALFSLAMTYPPRYVPPPGTKNQLSPIEAVMERLNQPSLAGAMDGRQHQTAMPESKTAVRAKQPSRPGVVDVPLPRQPLMSPITTASRTSVDHSRFRDRDTFVAVRGLADQEVRPEIRPETVAGTWQGTIPDLRFFVRVSETTEDKMSVVMYAMNRSGRVFPADFADFRERKLEFYIRSIHGSFEGEVAPDGLSISGTWKQAGISRPLLLERARY